jgi:hypothetical protein
MPPFRCAVNCEISMTLSTTKSGAHAPGSTGLTALRSWHQTVCGPHRRAKPSVVIDGEEEKSHINKYNSPPFRLHVYLWATVQ